MFRRPIVVCVGVLLLTAVTPLAAQDCPELVGRLPGPVSAVAVSGDYAYMGGPSRLGIADVSDPAAPRLVGEIALPGEADDVAVSGSYAYVTWRGWSDQGGLQVIDISNPSVPVEVGFYDNPHYEGGGVAVSAGYAYVAERQQDGYDWWYGLAVLDVNIPSAPVKVGSVRTYYRLSDVAVSGSYVYVTQVDNDGLSVIDVSTPSAPVWRGFVETFGAQGVAVSDGYAYVAGWGLSVVDVSLPWAPVEVGFVDTPGRTNGVAVGGGYAYVVGEGLTVIDVSTPSAPAVVGSITTPDAALGVAASGEHAYVAASGAGLRVIDVSNPSAPVEIGLLDSLRRAQDVDISGGYSFVVQRGSSVYGPGGRLSVIDVSTPSAPVEVGSVGTLGCHAPRAVAVSGNYAYVAAQGSFYCGVDFRVIDVSTPSAPVEVGALALAPPSRGSDVAVSGDHVFIAADDIDGWDVGLRVIDVSTPTAPVEVGSVNTPGLALGVAVSGAYAYVAAWEAGLRVFDVSVPSAPNEVGFVDTPGYAMGVAVSGGNAYVVGANEWPANTGTLRVIDVSVPSSPVEVGFVDTPGIGDKVAVEGGYAYLTAGRAGLRVIDVSTSAAPVEVGSYEVELPSGLYDSDEVGVAVSDGYVSLAAGEVGLYVLSECTRGPTPDARECFIPAAAVAAGAQGAFFQTDVEINNTGAEEAEVHFQWLPRGEDNSEPVESESIALAPGQSLRYENVLADVFSLGPDSLGALKMVASTESVIGMTRTYNIPAGKAAGTFGQGLPAIRATEMIVGTEAQRIIFLSEDTDSRANVGCINGSSEPVTINIGVFDAEGEPLETKTMDLGPYSNNQINRVFEDYAPVNGYVDVWADSDDALYYCYGSMLDNLTSDPTTILPQVPSADTTFIPAAALAAGLEGSFFQTDVDLNNAGSTDLTYELLWLPRGADNSDPVHSDTFSLAPGAGVRYANVLDELFGLEPDQVGALAVEASGIDLLAMSRTYNLPSAKVAGTFGQELPGIPADRMIPSGETKRIIFMSDNDDVRSNVGCVNGAGVEVAVAVELYDSDGVKLETKYMMLPPYSNRQINGIFQDYAPVNGYVDVRTNTPGAWIYCYGSVLDNLTSDPTTVLPQ